MIRITRRRLVVVGLIVVLAFLLWQGVSYAVVWKLTRRPVPPYPEPAVAIADVLPDDVRLTTSDGEQCGAWFVRGRDDRPVVILLHGNGGSRASTLPVAELLVPEGIGFLAVSQHAHGDSSGEINDFGWSAQTDVVAAVEFLERECPGRPIFVRGSSLGAAAAVFAAGRLGERVAGYVLECPYRDLATAVSNRTRMYLSAPVAAAADLGMEWTAPLVLRYVDMIAPVRAIGGVPGSVPVLVMAGGQDRHATVAEARELVAAAGAHARLVIFETADHEGLLAAEPVRYRDELLEFVRGAAR